MKISLLVTLLFGSILSGTAFAQKLSLEYMQPRRLEGKFVVTNLSSIYLGDPEFKPINEDQEFWYKKADRKGKKLTIKKLNKITKEVIWEKELTLELSENNRFCDLKKTGSGFIVFIIFYNTQNKECYLAGQKYDNELNAKGEILRITSTIKESTLEKLPVRYEIMEKNAHFLAYPIYDVYNQKNHPFRFVVITDKISVVYEKEIMFPENQYYKLSNIALRSDLNTKMLFFVSTDGKEIYDIGLEADYWVINYDYAKSDIKIGTITTRKQFASYGGEVIHFDPDSGYLKISGQYHKTEKKSGYEGFLNLRYNMNIMQEEEIQYIPYSLAIRSEMLTPKDANKGKLPKSFIVVGQLVDSSSGVTYVLQERIEGVEHHGGAQASSIAILGNIIVIKTNKNGEVLWVQKILRYAREGAGSILPKTMTYSYQVSGYTILLLNASLSTAKKPDRKYGYLHSTWKKNKLMAIVIDKEGTIIRTDAFSPDDDKIINCDMSLINKKNDATLELFFVQGNWKSYTRGILQFEKENKW